MRHPMNSDEPITHVPKKRRVLILFLIKFEDHAGSSNYPSKLRVALTGKALVVGTRETSQQSLPT